MASAALCVLSCEDDVSFTLLPTEDMWYFCQDVFKDFSLLFKVSRLLGCAPSETLRPTSVFLVGPIMWSGLFPPRKVLHSTSCSMSPQFVWVPGTWHGGSLVTGPTLHSDPLHLTNFQLRVWGCFLVFPQCFCFSLNSNSLIPGFVHF